MKISELKNCPKWLADADTRDADVTRGSKGGIIWHSGEWLGGEWHSGKWLGGKWHGGEWHSGVWHGGVWRRGEWFGGADRPAASG